MVGNSTRHFRDSSYASKMLKDKLPIILPVLALFVIAAVSWWLRLTGITLAGEAFCGMPEHSHTDQCISVGFVCGMEEPQHLHTPSCRGIVFTCGLEEHTHTSDCYSDIKADIESPADWVKTLPPLSSDSAVHWNVFLVADSQIGYRESDLNFVVDTELVKHGYTRYGEWYGNPYGEWSTMFVSFCLRYGGASNVPISGGAETMRLAWNEEGRFFDKKMYTPHVGDVVFLDKNKNGTADSTAIAVGAAENGITVIEGDLNDEVSLAEYSFSDGVILGFGSVSPENSLFRIDGNGTIDESESFFVPQEGSLSAGASQVIAIRAPYSADMFEGAPTFVVYTYDGSNYYAMDGDGNAIRITIDNIGRISADVDDPTSLHWTFEYCGTYDSQTTYYISNVKTGKYLHPYADNATNHGAVLTGRWESALYPQEGGIKIRGARQNAYAVLQNGTTFTDTGTLAGGSIFFLGDLPQTCYIWLDGTNGGLRSCAGSPNVCYHVSSGNTVQLPTEWQSPTQYANKLRGWYDVTNGVYYRPGEEVVVTGNMVLYADWVAATYDIGQFNASASNTVSSNHIITTHVFDYNYLFNVMSSRASGNISSTSHSESWSHVSSGTVPYKNAQTIDFIFKDNDSNGKLSLANNRSYNNDYHDATTVSSGIYNDALGEILFGTHNSFNPETGEGIIGKTYLGQGDYFFQYNNDPNSEHYGYYYYDSVLHAVSYNQSEQRFYVYDYLARSSDSKNQSGADQYSDFLPLNSPYANTNGKSPATYTYAGDSGEYDGVTHYEYDVSYSNNNVVGANMAFGMSMDMKFYLPDAPGTVDANGEYGNKDIHGNDMTYTFSGDDDLWVLVDGEVVLDIGGIHQIVSGEIDFSTGIVTVNGRQTGTLYDLEAGDHTLTVYYLERGSAMSNCAMYFNLAPRFSLDIQKEDVLTQELLDGAQFSVFTDRNCTVPAVLWNSQAEYEGGLPSTNVFTVVDGVAKLWGLSPSKTYYIKETRPPDAEGYGRSKGIICLTFDIKGNATFTIEIDEEVEGEGITGGYTAYGYHVDMEKQAAYIVITNAQDWVKEVTTVQAAKKWNDTKDHSGDYVTVYLTVTEADGTVRRIREAVLGEENEWTYTWINLPKFAADGVTPIDYGVEESYTPGYFASVEKVDEITLETYTWAEAVTFEYGGVYLLKTTSGYLSTVSSTDNTLRWETDEETAKNSPSALWTAMVSGSLVRFTNGNGQILTFNNGYSSSSRYFYATKNSTGTQNLTPVSTSSGFRFYATYNGRSYYMTSTLSNGRFSSSTSTGSALVFTPLEKITKETVVKVEDIAYVITNTPLDEETAFTVKKHWDLGMATNVNYEMAQVTVKLLANGKDAGRTVTLNLKNGWTDTFRGLPYKDENGNVIVYSVEEVWSDADWRPIYGEISTSAASPPTYSTTVINYHILGHGGPKLPSTGSSGQLIMILSGFAMMAGSLVYGCILRRKRSERRYKS